jgi:hypothetical protein
LSSYQFLTHIFKTSGKSQLQFKVLKVQISYFGAACICTKQGTELISFTKGGKNTLWYAKRYSGLSIYQNWVQYKDPVPIQKKCLFPQFTDEKFQIQPTLRAKKCFLNKEIWKTTWHNFYEKKKQSLKRLPSLAWIY